MQPMESTEIVKTVVDNIKHAIDECRLDAANFTSGLIFVAAVPRQLAEGQLIPEVLNACIEVARDRPTYGAVAVQPQSDYVEKQLPENMVQPPTIQLNAILATAVIVTAVSATYGTLTLPDVTHVITALKTANLMPSDCGESAVWERVACVCQCIKTQAGFDMPSLAVKGEGLTYAERRKMLVARLSTQLRNDLTVESRRQAAQRPALGFAARAGAKAPRTEGIPPATLRRIFQSIADSKERDEALAKAARNAELSRRWRPLKAAATRRMPPSKPASLLTREAPQRSWQHDEPTQEMRGPSMGGPSIS
jgi:hypothetical protein